MVARSLNPKTSSGIVNVFLPCELLHAMKVEPAFPEGTAVYFAASACDRAFVSVAERHGIPDSLCSYHKILVGAAESGILSKPRFIAHSTLVCDANQLTFRRLQQYYDVPRFCLDIPNSFEEGSVNYVANQLRSLERFLAEVTGSAPDKYALQEAACRSRETIKNYREYLTLRADRSIPPDMTGEMLPLFALHVLLGTRESLRYSQLLLEDMLALPPHRSGKKRIIWLHTLPNWQKSLVDLLDKSNVEICVSDLTLSGLIDPDPDTPYESMAKRVLYNTLNGSANRRIDKALEYAELLHADGIVYFNHWGCKNTLGASQQAKEHFERNGFPTLVLDGDGCDSGNAGEGQMITRLQAFFERLEGKTL